LLPSKLPFSRQHRLKLPPGSARTQVVPSQLFDQFFFSVNYAVAALHVRFGRESLPALTASFKSDRSQIRLYGACSFSLCSIFVGLLHFWFGTSHRKYFFVFLHLAELIRRHKTNRPSCAPRDQNPRDTFHIAPADESRVVVRSAFSDEKRHAPLGVAVSAEVFHLRSAESLNNASGPTRSAQWFQALRRPILDLYRDHNFLFT